VCVRSAVVRLRLRLRTASETASSPQCSAEWSGCCSPLRPVLNKAEEREIKKKARKRVVGVALKKPYFMGSCKRLSGCLFLCINCIAAPNPSTQRPNPPVSPVSQASLVPTP